MNRHGMGKKTRSLLLAAVLFVVAGTIAWIYSAHASWRNDTLAHKNVSYCDGTDPAQVLDFYRPDDNPAQNLPIVVYIHGGGWRGGDKNNGMFDTYAPLFLQHDMAVASVNYRLNPPHPYPDQNADIACALSYLHAHAADLHIDPSKTILMGESAGGELAAFAGLTAPSYLDHTYTRPVGVIDFYGVSDFTQAVSGQHPDLNARRYLGANYQQYAQEASPLAHVTPDAPAFLIFHGTADKVVAEVQSQALRDRLASVGAKVTYVALQNMPHGFIGPELPADQHKLLIDNIATFLRSTVGR